MRLVFGVLILYIFSSPCIACPVYVRFDRTSLTPDQVRFLMDDSPETCASFINHGEKAQRTNLRISIDDENVHRVNVTLIGMNIGCGDNLYVTPLSASETEKWTGRWSVCRLNETSTYKEKERCSYDCPCSGSCKEIQILKQPSATMNSSWTLCHLCLTYTPVIEGCSDLSIAKSGIYKINVTDELYCKYKNIYCDMETDGGGWTVLLRRMDGSVDFYREWEDYKFGFGSLDGEFWAGNELIHRLTNDGRTYTLRVDLTNYADNSIYAKYTYFSVGPESENYTLYVTGFDRNSSAKDALQYHDSCKFITPRFDNDKSNYYNLAMTLKAPWWYCSDLAVRLTGDAGNAHIGILWGGPSGIMEYNKYVVMMIRPNL